MSYLHRHKSKPLFSPSQLEEQAFKAAQRIFPCEPDLINSIPLSEIIHYFQKDLKTAQDPFLIRIAGQSGSGKSSQLLPAIKASLGQKSYIQINVGAFARFHPNYDEWMEKTPNEVREKTNGFALRALIQFYVHCVRQGVNIVLDMTLLEPEIDLYMMSLAQEHGYHIQAHVLCVPKKISNHFIRLRQHHTGREVLKTSSRYFFDALAPSLKALLNSGLFTPKDRLILWSHCHFMPIAQTTLNNRSAARILGKYRDKSHLKIQSPKALLKVKYRLMNLFTEEL